MERAMLVDTGEPRRAPPPSARGRRWSWRTLIVITVLGAGLAGFGTLHGATAKAPPAQVQVRGGNPLLTLVRDVAEESALVGRVEKRLVAGSYAYHALRIDRDGSTRWAVTLGKGVPVGTRVSVRSFGRRSEFLFATTEADVLGAGVRHRVAPGLSAMDREFERRESMLRSWGTHSAVVAVATMLGCTLAACGDDDKKKTEGSEDALCNSGALESDLDSTPFMGPGSIRPLEN